MKKPSGISLLVCCLVHLGAHSSVLGQARSKGLPADTTVTQVTDIDGNTYGVVAIGDQYWMRSNLRTGRYRNGDPIPQISEADLWAGDRAGAWCWYKNDRTNEELYGKLYNWYAATDTRGICPTGWHVPTHGDWKELELYLGMPAQMLDSFLWRGNAEQVATRMKMTGEGVWMTSPVLVDTDNNESGFSALPGGFRTNSGMFLFIGRSGYWWSSTSYSDEGAWGRSLNYYSNGVFNSDLYKASGACVRCMLDRE